MQCSTCSTYLSIQDISNTTWDNELVIFTFSCPICCSEKSLISHLFESGHISKPYLEMLVIDSENKEKQLDYMPIKQRQMLIDHLSKCEFCSSFLEEIRLDKISNEIEFNRNIYDFFSSKTQDVNKVLNDQEINIACDIIKSFKFNDREYEILFKNLIYESSTNNGQILCYVIEQDDFKIGMVSFLKTQEKIILDKIWIKSKERIQKEKLFLSNLKIFEFRILVDLIKKVHDFL